MKKSIFKEENELIAVAGDFPCVSVIMPLTKGFYRQRELLHQLNSVKAQLKKTLTTFYPEPQTRLVLEKFDHMTEAIHIPGRRKSLLLFVSPQVEKIQFLRTDVSPRIVIDHSFEIRDLAEEHTFSDEALSLVLSADKAVLYHLKDGELTNLDLGVPSQSADYQRDVPQKVANFSDSKQRKQILLEKFLRHIDRALGKALKSYQLPVYLVAPAKIAGLFKKYSQNLSAVSSYQHGNYVNARPTQLMMLFKFVAQPPDRREKDLLKEIEDAIGEKKLACGIREVSDAASHKNAKLLLVEEDFVFDGHQGIKSDTIYPEDIHLKRPVYIRNAVDDVIEKVIDSGGDIRFVTHNVLRDRGHIALIQYYRE